MTPPSSYGKPVRNVSVDSDTLAWLQRTATLARDLDHLLHDPKMRDGRTYHPLALDALSRLHDHLNATTAP